MSGARSSVEGRARRGEDRAAGGGLGAAAPLRLRVAFGALVVLLAAFVAGLAVAAWRYPGGNWSDTVAAGHDLWRNYWCDLMRDRAVNGASNVDAAPWSQAAFVALGLASALHWWLASVLIAGRLARRALLVCGSLAAVGALLVPLFTYDDYRVAHGVTTILAGGLACAAGGLLVLGGWRNGPRVRARRAWGVAVCLLMLANLGLYLPLALAGGGHDVRLPVVQKLATLVVLGWMLCTARAGLELRRAEP